MADHEISESNSEERKNPENIDLNFYHIFFSGSVLKVILLNIKKLISIIGSETTSAKHLNYINQIYENILGTNSKFLLSIRIIE